MSKNGVDLTCIQTRIAVYFHMRFSCSTGTAGVGKIVVAVLLAFTGTESLKAQDATYPRHKPSPPKIESQIVLISESVITEQWTHTMNLVNASQSVESLNPGQCVRVGIYATGDKRDHFLRSTQLSFKVQFAGHSEVHSLAFPSDFKQIKPDGGDFVAGVLAAVGVKQPEKTKSMASLGVSAGHWCVESGASDGIATVEAEVESPSGNQTLKSVAVHVESFETGRYRPTPWMLNRLTTSPT